MILFNNHFKFLNPNWIKVKDSFEEDTELIGTTDLLQKIVIFYFFVCKFSIYFFTFRDIDKIFWDKMKFVFCKIIWEVNKDE